jgi:serine/threonine protein kinase
MMEIIGKSFNGYRLLEPVGVEDGCNVFKAVDPKTSETVAIKIFSAEVGQNRHLVEKVRASFQSLSRLNHPAILPIKSISMYEGNPYIVMPFIEAGSLGDRIAAINIKAVVKDVVSALEHIHAKGLVHGDLKPSNILFDENGNALLGGIVEASLANAIAHQSIEDVNGVIDYQAPEVKVGEHPTPLSDQYSLALIALQLLTHLPVNEALKGLELQLENGRGFTARQNRNSVDLPPKVLKVLSRALAGNPMERFPSSKLMVQSLEAALWNEKHPSEQKPILEKDKSDERRSKPILIIGLGLIIALCLLLMGPVLTSQSDNVVGNIISFIGMTKEDEIDEDQVLKDRTMEAVLVFTLAPDKTEIGAEEGESQTPDGSPTEDIPGDDTGSSTPTTSPVSGTGTNLPPQDTATMPPQATPTLTLSPTPTQTEEPSSTPTSTSTPTPPPPTSQPTIDPDRCRRDPDSERYCTRTPEPTIPPGQCSRYYQSDNYCTPIPGATIPPDQCSRYEESDWYCTRTPEPTIPPDQCSRDYHDDNFCTRTPEP